MTAGAAEIDDPVKRAWPDRVKVPASVAVTVDGALSRLSTLIWLVKVPALTMSTESSVPSDGSNWATLRLLVQSVELVGIVAVRVKVVGAVLIVLSVANW